MKQGVWSSPLQEGQWHAEQRLSTHRVALHCGSVPGGGKRKHSDCQLNRVRRSLGPSYPRVAAQGSSVSYKDRKHSRNAQTGELLWGPKCLQGMSLRSHMEPSWDFWSQLCCHWLCDAEEGTLFLSACFFIFKTPLRVF